MRLSVLSTLILACTALGAVADDPATTPVTPADDTGAMRVACVGDSNTYGSGIADRDTKSYPAVLGKLLGEGYVVQNFGVGGATLQKQGDKPYWTLDEFKSVSAWQPQIIVINLGANDSKPHNWHGVAFFEADLAALLDHFAALETTPRILLCTPLPVHRDNYGIREAVVRDEQIPVIQATAKQRELQVIDLHAALAEAGADFPDGIHPNANAAELVAQAVATAIKKENPAPASDTP